MLAAASVFRRQQSSAPVAGLELSRLEAVSKVQCGAACQRVGAGCLAFRYSRPTCTLLAEPPAGQTDTFERLLLAPPAGYSACGAKAFRVLPPMLRALALTDCSEHGGRMAVPLTAAHSDCIRVELAVASATPGFNPLTLTITDTAYVGLTVRGPDRSVTDLSGAPVSVPTAAWAPGEPDGLLLEGHSAPVVLSSAGLRDWAIDSDLLMNVCELSLLQE